MLPWRYKSSVSKSVIVPPEGRRGFPAVGGGSSIIAHNISFSDRYHFIMSATFPQTPPDFNSRKKIQSEGDLGALIGPANQRADNQNGGLS